MRIAIYATFYTDIDSPTYAAATRSVKRQLHRCFAAHRPRVRVSLARVPDRRRETSVHDNASCSPTMAGT